MHYPFPAYNKYTKPKLYRFLEIMPAVSELGFLTLLVVLSFFLPIWVAIFIILYDLYWLFKVSYLSIHLIMSYKKLKQNVKIDWLLKIKNLEGKKDWRDLYQLVIVPFAIEGIEVLRPTFQGLVDANYPKDKMIVVLAAEERTWDQIGGVAKTIEKEFGDKFYKFVLSRHPGNLPNEIPGKGSNQAYAGKMVKKYIDEVKIPYEDIVVSVFDCDTVLHPEYFGCLAYQYLTTDKPTRTSYQPVPMFHNNIWDAPAIMRVVASSTSFWQMMEQGRPERLVTFSSHSMSFKALVDIGFWITDAVSEDSRVTWQCVLRYDGDYRVQPMLFPVSMDACLADTYWGSLKNQYKQQRRWAWGVENLPFALYGFIKKWKKIPNYIKMVHTWRLVDGSFSWATGAIIVAVVGWLPLFFGGEAFENTVFAQSLPVVTRVLVTLAMIGLFTSVAVSTLLLPRRPKKYKKRHSLAMILQWVLLPITTIFYGSIPAIDAHIRLARGKYMGFWVTQKTRKSEGTQSAGTMGIGKK